eukprot:c6923_g1_i2.p1 GENE.c6923_g1_i2~~c6923_g1_i2.p1  ORF type:complete len:560 (+),score=111.15 c6923_g1_i2:30-1682(+)
MRKLIGDFEVGRKIGVGSFASVYEAQHRFTQQKVAIKVISKNRLNSKLQANLQSEVSLLKSFDHPNVVKLYDVENTENHLFLIMEHCAGGDLAEFLKVHGKCSEELARNIISQLAAGLSFMRSKNVIHRDIKPQNLLLTDSPSPVVKIADFGFARIMKEGMMAVTMCGSPLYMAPEVMQYKSYDAKVDLWAVGAVLYELLTGSPPFPARTHKELLDKIQANDVVMPSNISDDCLQVLKGLLIADPIQRMGYDDFFNSPFVKQQATSIVIAPPTLIGERSFAQPMPPTASNHSDVQLNSRIEALTTEDEVILSMKSSSPGGEQMPKQAMEDISEPETLPISLKSPVFHLQDLFGTSYASETEEFKRALPQIEVNLRYALLLCDLAESKTQHSLDLAEWAQSAVLHIRGLDLLQANIIRITTSMAKPALASSPRSLAHELVTFLQAKYTDGVVKVQTILARLGPDYLVTSPPVEQLTYQHALMLGREAAVDELSGNLTLSFQRFDLSVCLMHYVLSLLTDEGDKASVSKFVASFRERQVVIGKRLLVESQVC